MLLSRNEVVDSVFLLLALLVGGMIGKRGRELLTDQELRDLSALFSGLDVVLLAEIPSMGIYSKFYSASVALLMAPIIGLILAYRFPYRIWEQDCPRRRSYAACRVLAPDPIEMPPNRFVLSTSPVDLPSG
jgi:hypothetical protein